MSQFPTDPSQNPFGDVPPPGPQYVNPYQPSPYAPQYQQPGIDPALGFIVPVGQSVWAIVSGYLGLLSLGVCFLGPLAVITGIVGIRDIQKHPGRGGIIRCVIGIVFGLLGSLGMVFVLITVIAARR